MSVAGSWARNASIRAVSSAGSTDAPVAGLHPQRDQTQCRRTNLIGSLRARDVGPDAVDLALVDDKVGVVALMFEDHGRDVVALTDGEAGGDAVLTHLIDLIRPGGVI